MFGRRSDDPFAKLLRADEELTPALASELTRLAKERGEPNVTVMLRGLTRLHAKQMRRLLAKRLEEREQQVAARRAQMIDDYYRQAVPQRAPRPDLELAIGPSGAIISRAERRVDDVKERTRAESLAAQRASEAKDGGVDAEQLRQDRQAADAARNLELPEHLRP